MKTSVFLISSLLAASAVGPAFADDTGATGRTPGTAAGQETSDRTPNKTTMTPPSQVTKTNDRETSTRTPSSQNEAEQGGATDNGSSNGSSSGAQE
jgi:hypothetical protein